MTPSQNRVYRPVVTYQTGIDVTGKEGDVIDVTLEVGRSPLARIPETLVADVIVLGSRSEPETALVLSMESDSGQRASIEERTLRPHVTIGDCFEGTRATKVAGDLTYKDEIRLRLRFLRDGRACGSLFSYGRLSAAEGQ